MSDVLTRLFAVSPGSYVESGVIQSRQGNGKYLVETGGRVLLLSATVADAGMVPGALVVINRTETGRYIVGLTPQYKSNQTQEVIING